MRENDQLCTLGRRPQTNVEDLFASLQLILKPEALGWWLTRPTIPDQSVFEELGLNDETQKPPTDVEAVLAVDLHGPTLVRNLLV